MTVSANESLVIETLTAMGEGDMKTALNNFSEDVHFHFKGTTPISYPVNSKSELIEFFKSIGRLISKPLEFEITRVIDGGDQIITESRGNSASREGKPYCNDYCHIWTVKEGKVVELIEYADTFLTMNCFGEQLAQAD